MKHYLQEAGSDAAIFPLPLFPIPLRPRSPSARVRQRYFRRLLTLYHANEVIIALNRLFTSYSSSCSTSYPHSMSSSLVHPPAVARRLKLRVFECCRRFVSRRDHVQDYTRVCLRDIQSLIHRVSPFDLTSTMLGFPVPSDMISSYGISSQLVPIIADRVSLPSFTSVPGLSKGPDPNRVPLLSLLPASICSLYKPTGEGFPNPALLRQGPIQPCPSYFGASQGQYLRLIKRMIDAGMLSFTTSPAVVNGLFGVSKPDGSIRLIIDARPTNGHMIEPPNVQLPSPTFLTRLQQLSGSAVYVGKLDLDNYYHRLLLPEWLWPYFALPAVRAGDIDPTTAQPDSVIYPCCMTLPMGWSHSVYIAQAIHLHILDRCDPAIGLSAANRILTESTSHRRIDRLLHSVYIDDNVLIGPDPVQIQNAMNAIRKQYAKYGLPVKTSKTVLPSADGVEVFGLELHGRHGTLGLSPSKMHRLVNATRYLLSLGYCTGHQLSILVGHWTWACLVRRESLSIFQHVYRFIQVAKTRIFQIWPSVRRELLVISSMAPLLFASLQSKWNPIVIATDASSYGMGVTATTGLSDKQLRSLAASPGVQRTSLCTASDVESDEPDMVIPLSILRTLDSSWSVIVSSPWRYQQHINALECHSILVAMRWLLSYPHSVNTRTIILSDSQVSVSALSKGRTSASTIIRVVRRIAALSLASGLCLSYVWIPSQLNPADEPSRRFY